MPTRTRDSAILQASASVNHKDDIQFTLHCLALLFALHTRKSCLAITDVISRSLFFAEFPTVFTINALTNNSAKTFGTVAFPVHHAASSADSVFARVLHCAGMLVLLAVRAGEGNSRAIARVMILDGFANASVLARSRGARGYFAILARIAGETFTGITGECGPLAQSFVLTGRLDDARVNVLFAILTRVARFASTFVFLHSYVVTKCAILARFFHRARTDIMLAILSVKPGGASAFIIGSTYVTAFGGILAGLLDRARSDIGFAIFTIESRFARTGIPAPLVIAGRSVFARIFYRTSPYIFIAILSRKSDVAFAFVIIAVVDAGIGVFARFFRARPRVYFAIFALVSQLTLAFITCQDVYTFCLVFAGTFDCARSNILFAILPVESGWTIAFVASANVMACSLILTRFLHRTRPDISLAVATDKSRFTNAMEIRTSVFAFGLITTGLAHGTGSCVILTISTFKTRLTYALVVFAIIYAFGVIFAWFLGTSLYINFTVFPFKSGSTFAIKICTLIITNSLMLTYDFLCCLCHCAWALVIFTVLSGKSGLASTSVFCAQMRTDSIIFARIASGTWTTIFLTILAGKSGLALTEIILSFVFTCHMIFARIFCAWSIINFTILTNITLVTFAAVLHSIINTFSMNARLAYCAWSFVYATGVTTEPDLTFARKACTLVNTCAIM